MSKSKVDLEYQLNWCIDVKGQEKSEAEEDMEEEE